MSLIFTTKVIQYHTIRVMKIWGCDGFLGDIIQILARLGYM